MITGWWCNNHLEKYEFVNGKDDMEWKIKNDWNHQPVFKSWCELYFTKLMSFHPFSLLVVTKTEMIVLASFCREWQLLQQMCGIQIPTPTKFWHSTRYENHVTVQTQLPNLHAPEICKQNDELLHFCLSKLPSWGSHPRFWLWSPICCWWNSSFAHQITMFAA